MKAALALDLANRDAYDPISPAHYRTITATEGVPSDRVQVFLGAFLRRDTVTHQLRRLAFNAGEPDEADTFLSTFHIGPVLFQVFFHDYPEPVTIARAGGTDDWVTEIWPRHGPARWPPKRVADDDVFQQLKEGLSPIRELRIAHRP